MKSKRVGGTLCQAYTRQKELDIVIPRLTRSYGPTLLDTDTEALSHFIRIGVAGENTVLKSEGTKCYSYTYICDAVRGFLYCLMKNAEKAYNVHGCQL